MKGRGEAAVQRKNARGAPTRGPNAGAADSLDEAKAVFRQIETTMRG